MIIKQRTFPRDIEQLQAIERRLPETHAQMPKVKEYLKNRLSGHKGELALNFPLSYLPDHYHIFHHLRLYDGTHYFQIDCLILTSQWMLIVEAKNMGGELFYNQRFNFLSRTWDEGPQTFSDPVLQVRRHRRQLQQWLHMKGFPNIPIYCLVANSHPGTSINTDDPSLDIVIRTEALPEKVDEINSQHSDLQKLSTSSLHLLSSELLSNHTENEFDYIKYFSLSIKDFKRGVFCTNCNALPMIRKHGTWQCGSCLHKDPKAHIPALKDYSSLIGLRINNRQGRSFLLINSPSAMQNILRDMNLRSEGENKGRVYFLK